jgi:3-hydroxymyristoyl/3-hydroxydecanoyl-(acyl carrier protein) dehydratase
MLEFTVTTTVAEDHPCLAGHFPGRPVVPAVLLLELAAEALRERIGEIVIRGLPAVKFLQPVLPGQTLQLHLRVDARMGRAWFDCAGDGPLAARGELRFSGPGLPAAGAA